MDQDLVVQRVLNGLVFLAVAGAVGWLATWLVGWFCRRSHVPAGLTLLAQVLTPVALFYLGSLYLDAAGLVATAQVESKDERISFHTSGAAGWNRSYWATVRFTTEEGPTQALLWLDEASFDALRPGTALDVRFVSWFPHIARRADESTRSLVPWRWVVRAGVAGGLGLALWLLVLRRRSPFIKGVAIFGAIGAAVLWLVLPEPWLPDLEAPVLTAQAEVVRTQTVTRSFLDGRRSHVEAPQPWEMVELRFVPEGRDQPVSAIDGVDVGSMPGIAVGARLPVRYNPENPRDARLSGTRTYRWREWLQLVWLAGTLVVVVGGFILLGRLASFWWRKLTTNT